MPARKFKDEPHAFLLRVPEKMFKRLQARAKQEGRSINDIVVEAIDRKLRRKRVPS